MRPPLTVDVALSPTLMQPARSPDDIYVVIDVIRATTTLCALFECGVRRVLIAPGIAEARAARARLGEGCLLAGEVGGTRPPGFDLGNAPSELAAWDLRTREIIFATTNGTRALRACHGGRAVFAGAFRNANAVVRAALAASAATEALPASLPTRSANVASANVASANVASANVASEAHTTDVAAAIVFVCSGRGERPAFDDTLCAGYLVTTLLDAARGEGRDVAMHEGAQIARSVWHDVAQHGDLRTALTSSAAGRSIESIGLVADLAWCAATDATTHVPTLTGAASDLLIVEAL